MGKKDTKKEPKNENNELLKIIGERVKLIRTEIGDSQDSIETKLQLSKLTFHRIEFGIGGTIPAFLSILQYFSEQGYNTKWIIEKDNNNELKKKEQAFTIDIDREKIKKSIKRLDKEMANLNGLIEQF